MDKIPNPMNLLKTLLMDILHRDSETKCELRKLMTALENLTAAVATLTTSVDAAVAVITAPKPDEAAIQAAADAIGVQVKKLDAAINPTPPPPAP